MYTKRVYKRVEKWYSGTMASQNLPQSEADLLRNMRHNLDSLRCRVKMLRVAGWTLRAIGTPLGARRSTVRVWEMHAEPQRGCEQFLENPVPVPANLRPAPHSTTKRSPSVRALRPDVPSSDADVISRLAPLARKVRGGTPPDSPSRQAKAEFDKLVYRYYLRGVPVQRLASLAGVTYRAMKVRLEAYEVNLAA